MFCKKIFIFWVVLVVFVGLNMPVTSEATTGSLEGKVISGDGNVLPGALVTVKGKKLMGERSVTTDADGKFRILLLPPGAYDLTVTLEGFDSKQLSNVIVNLGKVTYVDTAQMEMQSYGGEIVVIAAAPTIDTSSTTVGGNITSEEFARLPVARTYQDIASLIPGVDMDMTSYDPQQLKNSPTFNGSSAPENNYIIDGISTTDPIYGVSGTNLTTSFIDEVEVKTGGYEAEFGRATGGIINVITKSGGDEFHGDVFGFFNTYDMNGSGKWRRYKGEDSDWIGNQYSDYGADLGGYILKEKLWFFAAYNPSFDETKWDGYFGQELKGEWNTNHFAAKLTLNINPQHRVMYSLFGDPKTYAGAKEQNVGFASDEYLNVEYDYGSINNVLKYTGLYADEKLFMDFTLSRHSQQYDEGPENGDYDTPMAIYYWEDPTAHGDDNPLHLDGYRDGNIGLWQEIITDRDTYDLKGTYFLGSHKIKAGFLYEKTQYEQDQAYTGSYYVMYYDDYYRTRERVAEGKTSTTNNAFFIQDSWDVTSQLFVHFGLRFEQQVVEGTLGEKNIELGSFGDFNDGWSPRLGVSYDVLGNKTSKIFASYGRFYESIPMDINMRAFGNERDYHRWYYYGDDGIPFTYDNGEEMYKETIVDNSLNQVPVDEDLKGQYLDEYILGFDWEAFPNIKLGTKFIYRDLKRVVEDSAVEEDGEIMYFIVNPGEGMADNYDKPNREYLAWELTAERAFADNYQVSASYVYSQLKGNYEGLYMTGYDQLDPNITALYDFPEFNINSDGYLYGDRTHRFKLFGAYTLAMNFADITLGSAMSVKSGRPISALGWDPDYGYGDGTTFTTERGSEGRTPTLWAWDLHLEFNFRAIKFVRPSLVIDVFNVTNNNETVDVQDDRYTEEYDDAENPFTIEDPFWKDPTRYQTPRLIRVGFKISF